MQSLRVFVCLLSATTVASPHEQCKLGPRATSAKSENDYTKRKQFHAGAELRTAVLRGVVIRNGSRRVTMKKV